MSSWRWQASRCSVSPGEGDCGLTGRRCREGSVAPHPRQQHAPPTPAPAALGTVGVHPCCDRGVCDTPCRTLCSPPLGPRPGCCLALWLVEVWGGQPALVGLPTVLPCSVRVLCQGWAVLSSGLSSGQSRGSMLRSCSDLTERRLWTVSSASSVACVRNSAVRCPLAPLLTRLPPPEDSLVTAQVLAALWFEAGLEGFALVPSAHPTEDRPHPRSLCSGGGEQFCLALRLACSLLPTSFFLVWGSSFF